MDRTTAPIRIRVRLFAIQRELAGTRRVDLELPAGATVEAAWNSLVARVPALAPGRDAVRFAIDGEYADPDAALPDGAELAVVPPVSGGAGEPEPPTAPSMPVAPSIPVAPSMPTAAAPILEIRAEPFGPAILDELAARLATPADGAVVGFLGRTRETPGTPAPGQEAAAAAFEGQAVESLEYEAHESMALAVLRRIAAEIRERYGVEGLAIVHRSGEVPLGEASIAIVAVAAHRGPAFEAARYAIEETKARAPIWKAERFRDGRVWVGEPARAGPLGTEAEDARPEVPPEAGRG